MYIVYLTISALAGYFLAKTFSGKKVGEHGRVKSIRVSLGSYWLHLHHWIWATILIILFIALDFYNPFVLGLLTGLVIQGLSYSDFYKIIYKK